MILTEKATIRLLKGTKAEIKELVKYNDDIYKSVSHFLRGAIYKEVNFIKERKKNDKIG